MRGTDPAATAPGAGPGTEERGYETGRPELAVLEGLMVSASTSTQQRPADGLPMPGSPNSERLPAPSGDLSRFSGAAVEALARQPRPRGATKDWRSLISSSKPSIGAAAQVETEGTDPAAIHCRFC